MELYYGTILRNYITRDTFDRNILVKGSMTLVHMTKKPLIHVTYMPILMPNSLQKRFDKELAPSNEFDTQYISNPLTDEEHNVLLEED